MTPAQAIVQLAQLGIPVDKLADALSILEAMEAHLKAPVEARRVKDRERKRTERATASTEIHGQSTDIAGSPDVPSSPLVPPFPPAPPIPPIIPPTPSARDADFQDWYDIYPRKEAKGGARKAFKAACLKTSPDTLKAAARAFAAKCAGQDARFVPLPASWLNDERWQDAGLQSAAQVPAGRAKVAVLEGTQAWDIRKARGEKFPTVDIKDDNGRVIGRGWYFDTEYPEERSAA